MENAVEGLRAFGIRGCGVSMPYKEKIIPLLDEIDPEAAAIGAINTVVNTKGLLKGYNTDVYGVDVAIDKLFVSSHTKAIVVGAGGMSKAIVTAMKKKGIKKITLLLAILGPFILYFFSYKKVIKFFWIVYFIITQKTINFSSI